MVSVGKPYILFTLISFAILANSFYYNFLSLIYLILSSMCSCLFIILIFSRFLYHFCLSKLRLVSWSFRYSLCYLLIMSICFYLSISLLRLSAFSILVWIVSVNSLLSYSFMVCTCIIVSVHWLSFWASLSFNCRFYYLVYFVNCLSRLFAPMTKSLSASYSLFSFISNFLSLTLLTRSASIDAPSFLLLKNILCFSLDLFQLFSN